MNALNNEILESFAEIHRAIYKLVKKDADSLGITVVQLKALYKLSANPDIGLGDLAEKLRLTNSTVSGVIDRLVQNGFVERTVPPENRRVISIHLTQKGNDILEKLFSSESLLIKKMRDVIDLPEEEKKNLIRLHELVLSKISIEED